MSATITFKNNSDTGVSFVTHRGISIILPADSEYVMELRISTDGESKGYYTSFYNKLIKSLNDAFELDDSLSVIFDISSDYGGGGSSSGGGGSSAVIDKGEPGGVAELNSDGKVPSSQLPAFIVEGYYKKAVDRFYKEAKFKTLIDPEAGKLWIDVLTNKTYRWTGSEYARCDEETVSSSGSGSGSGGGVVLGETVNTAYAGNKGKQNADAIAEINEKISDNASSDNKLITKQDLSVVGGQSTDNGLVPLPKAGDITKFFRGDGKWIELPNILTSNEVHFVDFTWINGEKTSDTAVKYAVQLWGIKVDLDENDNPIGLTFGPALGADYTNSYHNHIPSGVSSLGNPKRCIHDDCWEEIIYWSQIDPEVYADCIVEGCTKAVPLVLNNTLVGSNIQFTNGDGSILYNNIKANYREWNIDCKQYSNSTNNGGWKQSLLRNTLNGVAVTNAAINDTLLTESNCLLSCFPQLLQDAIKAKKIVGDRDFRNTADSNATTYDKLWLFSTKEVGFGDASSSNSDIVNYSGHNGNAYITKLIKMGITDIHIGNAEANDNRKGYAEDGTVPYYWLRSPRYSGANPVWIVYNNGKVHYAGAYAKSGVAPGFCIG